MLRVIWSRASIYTTECYAGFDQSCWKEMYVVFWSSRYNVLLACQTRPFLIPQQRGLHQSLRTLYEVAVAVTVISI